MIVIQFVDHVYVGVSAYCFPKSAVILKPNKHKQSLTHLLGEIMIRELENNQTPENL